MSARTNRAALAWAFCADERKKEEGHFKDSTSRLSVPRVLGPSLKGAANMKPDYITNVGRRICRGDCEGPHTLGDGRLLRFLRGEVYDFCLVGDAASNDKAKRRRGTHRLNTMA